MKVTDKEKGLTAERLRELLDYSPETGEFRWRVRRGSARSGSVAGGQNLGYRTIRVDHTLYMAHRIAWLHAYSEWPEHEIDHVNGIKHDNRTVNLRKATRAENTENQRKVKKDTVSGLLGVSLDDRRNKFQARIKLNGKSSSLGYFDTAEEAHQAYLVAKRELHPFCTI